MMKKSLFTMAIVGLILWFPLLANAEDGKVSGKPFEYLQQKIDSIKLIPGAQGPQGIQGLTGPAGPQGPAGVIDQTIIDNLYDQINNLYDRIEFLENNAIVKRFADMGNGTIRDNKTGLIWLKNANCFGGMNWNSAMSAAGSLSHGVCGLSDSSAAGDWRLPTNLEWEAFMNSVYKNPALVNTVGDAKWSEGDAFIGVQSTSYYWSSTEYSPSVYAWVAFMGSGYMLVEDKLYSIYVWSVRSGN
ncbi:MAG: DUF1566 domain-containing protein [Desulfobacterales bacterium]|nr:DUF1566 domain-containing protein [Desulfobacterales bacterium]